MKLNKFLSLIALCVALFSGTAVAAPDATTADKATLRVSTQQRIPSPESDEPGARIILNKIAFWDPAETAIVICDMWDKHWCAHATARVAEMAPALNEVITLAREKGVAIVHAPSETLGFYKEHPARKRAETFRRGGGSSWSGNLPTEKGAKWPIDAKSGGCTECKHPNFKKDGRPWKRQIETLSIADEDFISDHGAEVANYFKEKGIKNVILTGVHTNMCVIGRPFGLRALKGKGFNVVLMRDMTDLMYNNPPGNTAGRPHVDHFSGLDLMVEYIEAYVTPTILSTDFTGKKQFRFKEDTRPRIAFITAESEYRANQRLPEFAHELTLKGIHSDFILGVPVMQEAKPLPAKASKKARDEFEKAQKEYAKYGMKIGDRELTRHNLENLQALDSANLAVFFIRRRALEPEKMAQIKAYITSRRPVLALRTSSHGFDAKGNVPRSGGAIETAKNTTAGNLAQWPEFDKDVLGGNYKGHYGHLKTGTDVSHAPGVDPSHPLLNGVEKNFNSPNWLYKNTPLRTTQAQVLLIGSNPGVPDEPIFWLNGDNVIYTSLGHWDDWKIPSFRNLMLNSVNHLLNPKPLPTTKTTSPSTTNP